ncbi:hypothetical protein CDD81_3557 [Ophiocordyceps australis]|uniref:Uncharacterized protein n=1 Tax=Ophiocordyceps australis TaxID=1399860 RepID=A0A2C5XPL5_9HYPO|nr:hypothetical protein CDD81_3557 [Ophiocordyceps australis]
MREFVIALSASKIKLMFAQVSEPSGTSKPAYFNSRPGYNRTSYSKGSSSKASTHTPGKKQSVGFEDEDIIEDPSKASPNVNSPENAKFTDSAPRTPQTAAVMKHPMSAAGRSTASRRSVSIGFADSDSDSESKTVNDKEFDVVVSDRELQDLSYVSDFIDPASENCSIELAVIEFVQESIRTRRAVSSTSKDLLSVVRNTHHNSKCRSIANALGYDDSVQDMSSPIMQWVLKNAATSK